MKIAQLQKTVKRYLRTLRLLDSLGILSKTGSETFRAILLYRKKKESHKKNICYRPKISAFHKGFDRGNRARTDIEKFSSKRLLSNAFRGKAIVGGCHTKVENRW